MCDLCVICVLFRQTEGGANLVNNLDMINSPVPPNEVLQYGKAPFELIHHQNRKMNVASNSNTSIRDVETVGTPNTANTDYIHAIVSSSNKKDIAKMNDYV